LKGKTQIEIAKYWKRSSSEKLLRMALAAIADFGVVPGGKNGTDSTGVPNS